MSLKDQVLEAVEVLIDVIQKGFDEATADSDQSELTILDAVQACLLMAGDILAGTFPQEADNWLEQMCDLIVTLKGSPENEEVEEKKD